LSVPTWKGEPGDYWVVRSTNGPVVIADQGATVGAEYVFVAWSPDLLKAHLDKKIQRRDQAQLVAHEPPPDPACDWRGCERTGPVLNHYYIPRGADGLRQGRGMIRFCPEHDPWMVRPAPTPPAPEPAPTPVVVEPAAAKPLRGAAKALFDLASERKANEYTSDKDLVDLLNGKTGHLYGPRQIQNAKKAVREHGWPKPA
jgi:hypothetical protein